MGRAVLAAVCAKRWLDRAIRIFWSASWYFWVFIDVSRIFSLAGVTVAIVEDRPSYVRLHRYCGSEFSAVWVSWRAYARQQKSTPGDVGRFFAREANPVDVAKHFGFGHQVGGLAQCAEELIEHSGVSLPGSYRARAAFFLGQGCVDSLLPTSAEPASGTKAFRVSSFQLVEPIP